MKTPRADLKKVAFNLYPGEHPGDRIAADLIENTRLKERGSAMRDLLLTGAALSLVDERLPRLIASVLDDDMGLERIKKLIGSIVPDAFAVSETAVVPPAPAQDAPPDSASAPVASPEVDGPTGAEKTEQQLAREAMRRKANVMLGSGSGEG